jgi:hypothetical protein
MEPTFWGMRNINNRKREQAMNEIKAKRALNMITTTVDWTAFEARCSIT